MGFKQRDLYKAFFELGECLMGGGDNAKDLRGILDKMKYFFEVDGSKGRNFSADLLDLEPCCQAVLAAHIIGNPRWRNPGNTHDYISGYANDIASASKHILTGYPFPMDDYASWMDAVSVISKQVYYDKGAIELAGLSS